MSRSLLLFICGALVAPSFAQRQTQPINLAGTPQPSSQDQKLSPSFATDYHVPSVLPFAPSNASTSLLNISVPTAAWNSPHDSKLVGGQSSEEGQFKTYSDSAVGGKAHYASGKRVISSATNAGSVEIKHKVKRTTVSKQPSTAKSKTRQGKIRTGTVRGGHSTNTSKGKGPKSLTNSKHPGTTASQTEQGTAVPRIIRPRTKNAAFKAAIEKTLRTVLGPKGKFNIVELGNKIMFWGATMSEEQVKELQRDKHVSSVTLDPVLSPEDSVGGSTKAGKTPVRKSNNSGKGSSGAAKKKLKLPHSKSGKRSIALEESQHNNGTLTRRNLEIPGHASQPNAPWELELLSFNRQNGPVTEQKYYYQSRAGRGVTIYGIDSGLNKQHEEVQKWRRQTPRPSLRYIYAPGSVPTETDDLRGDANKDSHGSAVWAKAVGPRDGVAKLANWVAVKLGKSQIRFYDQDRRIRTVMQPTVVNIMDAVVLALRDIESVRAANPGKDLHAIITMSVSAQPNNLPAAAAADIQEMLLTAKEYGVPVFISASNVPGPIKPEEEAFMPRDPRLDNVFFVGGTDRNDMVRTGRQGSATNPPGRKVISFWAPSEGLSTIVGNSNRQVRETGNSLATPMVAGMAAYCMSLTNGPRTGKEVGEWLTKYSKPRADHGPPIIGNEYAFSMNELLG